jgi:hypothetical protein
MIRMLRFALAALGIAVWCSGALSQNFFPTPGGSIAAGTVMMCPNGSGQFVPCSTASPLAVNATVTATASISGVTAATVGTPISVSTTSTPGTLPAGTVVVATNVGTNGAFCELGATGTTAAQFLSPGGGWFAFTVGASTQLSCITSSGSTTVNLVGGAGLPTGAAAGTSSGGGGGSVTIASPLGTQSIANSVAVTPATSSVFPISATSLPLPIGAATAALQPALNADGGALSHVTNFPATQPISAAALPLPSGAATSALQTTGNTSLATIATNSAVGQAVTVSHAATTALGSSLSAKTSAGDLLGFNCTAITGGSAGFCVVVNSATVPATGALTGSTVLDFCSFDTTARGCSLGRAPAQVAYSAGIQVLVTSAASPYTFTTGTDTAAISADFQ